MSKKIYEEPEATPPGEVEHRALIERDSRRRRVMTHCPYCDSVGVRLIQRPNIFWCLHCKKRFNKLSK